MEKQRQELIGIIKDRGYRRSDDAIKLASGDWSRHFIDVKRALAVGTNASLAGECILETTRDIDWNAVGGLTMGADVLAHSVALVRGDAEWFTVRKQAKDRGTKQRIEGAVLGPDHRVLLVDDVVTRGGSIFEAFDVIEETGARVVAAVTVVDRGDDGKREFERRGVPYFPLMTWADLGIPKVGTEAPSDQLSGRT